MRVKAFSQETAIDLEREIDAWLSEHPAITIATAVQSMGRSFAGDRIVLTLFYTEPAQADDAPRRGRSERDREEPDLTHQSERHPPRPAMAPPSSGAGRASPLPRGSELPASQPPVSNLAPSPPRNAPLKLGYWRKVGTICSWWTRPLYGQAG